MKSFSPYQVLYNQKDQDFFQNVCIGNVFLRKHKPLKQNSNVFLKLVNINHDRESFGVSPEAEFKEFEKRLKNGWFHLKLYSVIRDLCRRSIGTGFWRFNDAVLIL